MNRFTVLLLLVGAAGIALWMGDRELATGLLIVVGLWAKYLQHRDTHAADVFQPYGEEETSNDDRAIPYPQLILAAMDWAASGKTAYVPATEDPQHPRRVYVGYDVPSGMGQGQTFLPEIEVSEDAIQPVHALGAAASRGS